MPLKAKVAGASSVAGASRIDRIGAGDASVAEAGSATTIPARGSPHLAFTDGALGILMTGVTLAGIVRAGEPTDLAAAMLACVGPVCLIWRRVGPMTVLVISAASFGIYQAMGFAHVALPFSVLIALYTVAARSGALVAAAASSVLVIGAIGSSIIRSGWSADNFDDELFAYFLSVGAACALGYAVQLSRARSELLHEQAARLASEHTAHEQQVLQQEQARIARELHDVVAHQVSVITALAAGADRVFESEPDRARRALNSIEIAGREALTEMRRLLRILRTDIDDVGLVPQPGLTQLAALVAQTERAGLQVRLRVTGKPQALPAGLDVSAYRIVQEALTNILKHAGPARADVLVSYEPKSLFLQIVDDGRGMPSNPTAGQGLIGMHERAVLVGGKLAVTAVPSGGVRVTARLPLAGESA